WCTDRNTLTNIRCTHRNIHVPKNSVAEKLCCLNRLLGGFKSHCTQIKLAANLCCILTDIGVVVTDLGDVCRLWHRRRGLSCTAGPSTSYSWFLDMLF